MMMMSMMMMSQQIIAVQRVVVGKHRRVVVDNTMALRRRNNNNNLVQLYHSSIIIRRSQQQQQQQQRRLLSSTLLRSFSNKNSESSSTTSNFINSKEWFVFGIGICVGSLAVSQIMTTLSSSSESSLSSVATCNEKPIKPLTDDQKALPSKLSDIVGKENIMNGYELNSTTIPFLKGTRLGCGKALCIVTPTTLQDVLQCLQHIVDAHCVIIPQGQNTSLTGGSVPRDDTDDRPVVIVSMKKLNDIIPMDGGERVLCLGGAGLASLERFLVQYFPNRESHSQLGSTFLNPTTAAGVAYGSGGTQCRKGPAYTDRALYIKFDQQNKWKQNIPIIVNTLGIQNMIDTPRKAGAIADKSQSVLYKLDTYCRYIRNKLQTSDHNNMLHTDMKSKHGNAQAHMSNYKQKLVVCCDHDHHDHDHDNNNNNNLSRYNADCTGLECNRSEGKVFILATVHDTFEKPKQTKTYWISLDSYFTALQFREKVALTNSNEIPITMEYMNYDSFDIINNAGRIMGNVIKFCGPTSNILRQMWNCKLYIEGSGIVSPLFIDKLLYHCNHLFPAILPKHIMETCKHYNHHITISIGDYGNNEIQHFEQRMEQFMNEQKEKEQNGKEKDNDKESSIVVHECTSSKTKSSLSAFRFVAAPAFRTWCVGQNAQGVSVDYVLPKNPLLLMKQSQNQKQPDQKQQKYNPIPPMAKGDDVTKTLQPIKRMRYSHFGCHVVHEDIAFSGNATPQNVHDAKMNFKYSVESNSCYGKLPAEHGHGTEYNAPNNTKQRWKNMDPLNVMNPGVGGLSYQYKYGK